MEFTRFLGRDVWRKKGPGKTKQQRTCKKLIPGKREAPAPEEGTRNNKESALSELPVVEPRSFNNTQSARERAIVTNR